MFKNYLKIAVRSIKNQFSYSVLNVLGLAVGLICATFIFLYVQHELNYDEFHEHADRIYRADFTVEVEGGERTIAVAPTALLPTLVREFPEVVKGVRIFNSPSAGTVKREDHVFRENKFFYADSTFFDVFTYPLAYGNPETALVQPHSVVLTKGMARKYFSNENPMGRTLEYFGSDYTVTGIFEDIPDNSYLNFDFVASFTSLGASRSETWSNAAYQTYLLLQEPSDAADVRQKLPGLIDNIFKEGQRKPSYDLIALTDIHLYSDREFEYQPTSDISYIYIFSAIGILILGIASINYMNMATARSTRRAQEVGIRKVLGAYRSQLKKQFLGESMLNILFALLITILMLDILLPLFNKLTGKSFVAADLFQWEPLLFLAVSSVVVGILSGLYPAFMLSRFEPVKVLKGSFSSSAKGKRLRKVLVITQFAISAALIMGTLGIRQQLNYFQQKSLGYDKENVFSITVDRKEVVDRFATLKSEFLQHPDVANIALASEAPTQIRAGYNIQMEGIDIDPGYTLKGYRAYPDLLNTLGIELVTGRFFTQSDVKQVQAEQYSDRTYAFILNESALSTFNLTPEEAMGRRVNLNGRVGPVVGIAKDFHFSSLRSEISPLAIFVEPSYNKVLVRLKSQQIQRTIFDLQNRWASLFPELPFSYEFLDQQYNALYRFEQKISQIFSVFAIIAVIVACLGLFGLASYMAVQRTRELSIRKVLGATAPNLVALVTKDFAKLILISAAVGLPISYIALNNWLNSFAYRIELDFQLLLTSFGTIFIIALFTVSFQAVKASMVNPIDNLGRE